MLRLPDAQGQHLVAAVVRVNQRVGRGGCARTQLLLLVIGVGFWSLALPCLPIFTFRVYLSTDVVLAVHFSNKIELRPRWSGAEPP